MGAAMIRKVIAAIGALVAGCGTNSYVPPSEGPTAILSIETRSAAPIPVFAFSDAENCKGRLTVHDRVQAGVPARINVQANRPFTVGVAAQGVIQYEGRARGLSTCHAAVTFVPSEGQRYVARYQARDGACTFSIFEQVAAPGGHARYLLEKTQRLRSEASCKQ
jgi:hypothetical protein